LGHEGTYFVTDIIESLWGKEAELKPVEPARRKLLRVPIERIRSIPVPARGPLDFFSRIIIQGLKPNMEQMQTAFYCNTIFKSYQFRPLLKYLDDPERRILIADETGLGKTIEAGYILVNEMSSGLLQRVVVLCPANLQYKWQGELWQRFGLHFDIVSGKMLFNLIADEKRKFNCIASMDSLRAYEGKSLGEFSDEYKLDLLIIDEIHHMIGRGGEILRRKLGIALSLISGRVIGLTATPVHLEMMDLKRVLDIIRPGWISTQQFEKSVQVNSGLNRLYKMLSKDTWKNKDIETFRKELTAFRGEIESIDSSDNVGLKQFLAETERKDLQILEDKGQRYNIRKAVRKNNTFADMFTRTRKAEVGEERPRNIRTLMISLDGNLFEAFQEGKIITVSEKILFKEIDEFLKSSFSLIHRRQLYSCLPAMIGLLRNGMRGFNIWVDDRWMECEAKLTKREIVRCEELANKFGLLAKDTKWEELKRTIRQLYDDKSAKKVIVFTQWVPTIEYFRQKKQEIAFPSYVVSGQDNENDRTNMIVDFQNNEGFSVLFTTDVMSEGLDLQSADCIINYDFPFNPQRIEQRIGRIDRIGQKSGILTIINMFIEAPLDMKIHDVLVERIKMFEKGIGDLPGILIEKIEKEGTLDNDDIIIALRENETRRRLLESDALLGLDDVLDDRVEIFSRTRLRGIFSLRWMAFERLMFLMLGEKRMRMATIDADRIVFRQVEEVDIDVLSKMVDIKDRAAVREELQAAFNIDGTLKISFTRGADGLYLPYFHPLMQKALEVCYSSFFGNLDLDNINTEMFSIKGSFKTPQGTKFLLLVEFGFEGKVIHDRKWSWWALGESQTIREIEMTVVDIWKAFASGQLAIGSAAEVSSSLLGDIQVIQRIYEEWINEMQIKDTTQYIAKIKAEIRRYIAQLNELNRRSQKHADYVHLQENTDNVYRIKEYIDRLKCIEAQIQRGSPYENVPRRLRFVAALKVEPI
jgi:superfamily II DNA or RNA helicase